MTARELLKQLQESDDWALDMELFVEMEKNLGHNLTINVIGHITELPENVSHDGVSWILKAE